MTNAVKIISSKGTPNSSPLRRPPARPRARGGRSESEVPFPRGKTGGEAKPPVAAGSDEVRALCNGERVQEPPVAVFYNGRVEIVPRTARVALIWVPIDGPITVRLPARTGNLAWLRASARVRSPKQDERGDWKLPRASLTRFITASVDRFGWAALCREISKLSACTRACQEATGAECSCICLGEHHGENSGGWYEKAGDLLVADRGEMKLSVMVYGGPSSPGQAVLYAGELAGRRYSPERSKREGWPRASQFMCAACATDRAAVWDHCHRHGFVRAPLCTRCNTRHWTGWHPEYGRSRASSNVDTDYYRYCPEYALASRGFAAPCSR